MNPAADIAFDPAPGSKRRWFILVLVTLGFLLSLFYRVSMAVISPQLTSELSLSSSELSLLAAAFFYAFAALQIPLGLALDRIGPRHTMGVLGMLGVAGAVLFAMADSLGQALAGRILLGIGMGCNLMGILALIAAWFPVNRFAYLTGLTMAVANLGGLVAATPLQFLGRLSGLGAALFWPLRCSTPCRCFC
jgi:MFS family permease